MTIPRWARRLIRPLIPDRVMARFRLRQQSRGARVNVDVLVPDLRRHGRWLRATPDTYRVRAVVPASGPPPAGGDVLAFGSVDPEVARRLAALLAEPAVDAAVLGEVDPPRLVNGVRAEPRVGPVAMAVRTAAVEEAGPLPQGRDRLPALHSRLRDAGRRLALIPVPRSGAPLLRADPIEAPAAVVLSLVPLHDVGGGSRPAQLARALLRRGFHVTFVNALPSNESADTGLRFLHPLLEQAPAEWFDPDALASRTSPSRPRLVIAAAPAPALAAAAADLRRRGFLLIYDVIDDFSQPELGGDWYRPAAARRLEAAAHAITASAPDLVAGVAALGRTATLVPNGVDTAVFGRPLGGVPDDFPAGAGPVFGYHGSLWPDWFDWEGVAAVAAAHPEARILLIGDHRGRSPAVPANVSFLGLKPQEALADYVGRFDVGLVPRVVGEATHAMSPLKVYEYLASGVRVAAPPLRSLEGLDGVVTAPALDEAVRLALEAPVPDPEPVRAAHSWQRRVEALLGTVDVEIPAEIASPAVTVLRPPRHYAAPERVI